MAYTVTLDPQGGWTTMPSVTFNGTSMPDVAIPYRDYYTFNGYYDQANGAGTQYFTSAGIAARSWDKGADATLYASWTDATPSGTRRTVTLNKDGGTGGTDGPIYGYSGYKLPQIQPPTKDLYMFAGYYYGTTQYIDAQGAPTRNFDRSANTTLKAKWEPLPVWYTVTFDTNGGFIIPDGEKTYEYQVGRTYGSQKNFPPSSFAWRTANGTWAASRRWGGRGGQSWTYGSTTVSGQDFGSSTSPYRYSPWEDLAEQSLIGWFDAPVGGNEIKSSDICALTKDTTLYAHWDFSTATFKFDAQGGTFPGGAGVQTVKFDLSYGRPFGRLPVPTRAGYRFQGWFTLPKGLTLDEQYLALGHTNPTSIDNSSIYSQAAYVEEYKSEKCGGRKILATDTFDPVASSASPLGGPAARFFYLYDTSWNLWRLAIRTFSWNWLSAGAPETGDAMTLPTLYAHWTDGTPDVVLNDRGGSGGDGVITVGSGGVLPSVTPPTKSGATFLGYFRYADGRGTKYYNADGSAAATWDDASDGEIFAAWYEPPVRTPITVRLMVGYANAAGTSYANVGSLGRSITVYKGEKFGPLPEPPADTAGYKFAFWQAAATGWPSSVSSTDAVTPKTIVTQSSSFYLVASMANIPYKIEYVTGGVSLPVGAPTSYYGGVVTLPTVAQMNALAPSGLVFGGWYTSADYSGSPVTQIYANTPGGDKKYWAKWQPLPVTVTFDANGGTVSPSTAAKAHGEVYGTLPEPVKSGYVFEGWHTAGGEKITSYSLVDALSGTITLTAHWAAATPPVQHGYVKYRLKLNANGGTISSAYGELKYIGGYAKALPTAAQISKSGATFGGWYSSADFTGDAVTTIPAGATGSQTFYAFWV